MHIATVWLGLEKLAHVAVFSFSLKHILKLHTEQSPLPYIRVLPRPYVLVMSRA